MILSLLSLLLLLTLPSFVSPSCLSQSKIADCIKLNSVCYWNSATNACASGLATSCSMIYLDSSLCNRNSSCHLDSKTSICTNGAPCSNFDSISCLGIKYCSVNFTLPTSCSSTIPASCFAQNSSSSCSGSSCYWDSWLNYCFNSVAQANLLTGCSYWGTSSPCLSHGCYWSGYSGCTSTYVPIPAAPTNTLPYSRTVSFTNPRILPNSMIFKLDITVPLSLDMSRPYTSLISIGNLVAGNPASVAANFIPKCTSSANNTVNLSTPQVVTLVNNSAALNSYYLSTVNSSLAYNFSSTSTFGQALSQFFGSQLSILASNPIFNSVAISVDFSTTIYTMSVDLNWLYSNCASMGMSRSSALDNSVVYYTIPINWIDITKTGTLYYNNAEFQVGVVTAGVYSFIPQTVPYSTAISILSIGAVSDGCMHGFQRLIHSYQLTFSGIYTSNVMVGPFLTSNVYASDLTRQCYGDMATNVSSPPSCSNSACINTLTISTNCMSSSFSQCQNATLALLNPSLNGYHEFNVNVMQCMPSSGIAPSCTYLSSPNSPITIRANFSNQVISVPQDPIVVTSSQFLFDYSIFPLSVYLANSSNIYTVTDTLTASPIALSNQWASQANLDESDHDSFIVSVQFHDPNALNLYTMYLDTANFSIAGTDRFGNVLTSSGNLKYSDISSMLNFLPLQSRQDSCIGCSAVPNCQDFLGCDGIGIQQNLLINLLPDSDGFLFTLAFHFIPYGASSNRRLLTTNSGLQGRLQFFIAKSMLEGAHATSAASSSKAGIIAGSAVGGVGFLFLLGLLIRKKMQSNNKQLPPTAASRTEMMNLVIPGSPLPRSPRVNIVFSPRSLKSPQFHPPLSSKGRRDSNSHVTLWRSPRSPARTSFNFA